MSNIVKFPVGEDRPYDVRTELFKTLNSSKLPQILIDIFKRGTLSDLNVISTEQWNLNSFGIFDRDPEMGGISIITDFREVKAPLFGIKDHVDYIYLKYFTKSDNHEATSTKDVSLDILLNSYIKYLPSIATDNWKFIVNLLDVIDRSEDVVVDGFTIENSCFGVKFSDPNNLSQSYAIVINPLPLILDVLAFEKMEEYHEQSD